MLSLAVYTVLHMLTGGGGGDDDPDDNDGNNNNSGRSSNNNNDNRNNNNNRRARGPNARYRDSRYRGMLRTHAAFFYDPADFVHVTDVGDLTRHCTHCDALTFPGERKGLCCNSGKVSLPLPATTPLLQQLSDGSHERSAHFLNNIRQYNGLFSFTSFAANVQFMSDNNGNRAWTPCFKVLGQLYHRIGSIFPSDGQQPRFMQIYFLSQAEQLARRLTIFDGLNSAIIQSLTEMLHEVNPYVTQLQSAASTLRRNTTPNLKVFS